MVWREFRIWYGESIDVDKLFNMRRLIIPILDEHAIEDFLVLNEPEFALFRVEIDEALIDNVQLSLQGIVDQSENTFSRVTVEMWDPELDARARIMGAAQRLGIRLEDGTGWMIAGREPLHRHWIPTEDDLELKISEFSTFMKKVVGKFTRAYVEEMPRSVMDRWLLSVMVHLLLNSISVGQTQEGEIREFPYV